MAAHQDLIRTESYFRRTCFQIFMIIINLGYIISCSIAIGIVIFDIGDVESISVIMWFSICLFSALFRLFFEIHSIMQKDSPHRGTYLLLSYCFSGFLQMYSTAGKLEFERYGNYIFIILSVSFFINVFYFVFSIFYCFVLICCPRYGFIEHNVSIRHNCCD